MGNGILKATTKHKKSHLKECIIWMGVNNMEYYITYRNLNKPERTPIMGGDEQDIKHNVELLKIQGATSIRVHKEVTNE
jgi:hypothetical protein